MNTTRLSTKGQVIIPKHIRETHHWDPGMEFQVVEFEGDVLLEPKAAFSPPALKTWRDSN
ncbi:AbrB/MazE/SpoVT family DNA-binding domain-containing protein [Pseudohongiella spirulinae]|uniref:AbrB/MazE/SpoVT family DNA-binding domain-containing protein n=1 Tax=Pseudohongiella spirulinae TaxID=1249552 RepID=UPI0009EC674C|nr:AbrB/MazE/SpoVT family DNA-binding domain-containing protein [Pseudohongiella spirulinae]